MSDEVSEGQVWLDCDARPANRTLLVKTVGHTHASCKVFKDGKPTGRDTVIRIDRFKPGSRGYRLIESESSGR